MSLQNLAPSFFERPIRLRPRFSVRPWGGDALTRALGKALPPDLAGKPVGESWELSDHPDGRSTVVAPGTAADGVTFGDLLRAHPAAMIGLPEPPSRYPLLVKYLDAAGDLSVQVHPDDQWCAATGHDDRGKSECWYIIDCPADARIIYGYRPDATEATVRQAITEGRLRELLNYAPVKPGDFVPVPPRTVHAMLTGLVVCEIQQSSNTTFRLYDWDRLPARELHIEPSMQVSRFGAGEAPIRHFGTVGSLSASERLISNEFFTVDLHDMAPARKGIGLELAAGHGAILNVVGGSGRLYGRDWMEELALGETLYLPAAMGTDLELEAGPAGLRILRTVSREIG